MDTPHFFSIPYLVFGKQWNVFFPWHRSYFSVNNMRLALEAAGFRVLAAVGGDTLFANTSRAYTHMPAALKRRIEGLTVRHHFDYGALHYGAEIKKDVAATNVSAVHRVVGRHPATGAPILMVNPQTTDCILGVEPAESRELIAAIVAAIAAPDNVYRHKWRPKDLVVWDNLLLQHARSDFDNAQRRTLRRCAIAHDLEPQNAG
jgi:alpha-ketoglutarate-dependent taurine dioxygenase